MTTRAMTAALALLVAASACGGSATTPARPPPPPLEPVASNCGPGDAPPPEVLARYVELFRTYLLEYEDVAGPALGDAAWSEQRGSFRARLGEAGDIHALAVALVALEAGLASHMPVTWRARRAAWAQVLGSSTRLTVFGEALRELMGVSMKSPGFDDERREHLRRNYTRLSLLFDTCLATGG